MKYITAEQYESIKDIPRGRLAARFLAYAGAIIVKDNKILLCESNKSKYPGWQLPGGKVLWSEPIIDCLKREVLEETGFSIEPKSFVGVFQRLTTAEDEEYIRFIFSAEISKEEKSARRDPAIKQVKWFDLEKVLAGKIKMQSKQILKEIKLEQKGKGYPINIVNMYKW